MRTPSYRSFVPILTAVTLLTLFAPSAQAAGRLSSRVDGIWGWLSYLWVDTGCTYDPNSACHDCSAPPVIVTATTGCEIDPLGGCRDRVQEPLISLDRSQRP